ncbi:hypothetical protein R1sor_006293 [Riccia sorocarpa]|uniref:Uncharacterized protein n=1 Tax=Riccia sorocarpa TaxID=122646 RepID=A0ABD3HM65_9MARC
MRVGNSGVSPELEPGSLLRSTSANGLGKNGSGKSKSTSKLYRRNRSLSFSAYSSPPPLKKCKRVGCSTCGVCPASEAGSTFVYACASDVGAERRESSKANLMRPDAEAVTTVVENGSMLANWSVGDARELGGETRCMPSLVKQHSREEIWRRKSSEKVSQWLENSCQSSMSCIAALPAGSGGSDICSELEAPVISAAGPVLKGAETYSSQCSDVNPERIADSNSCTSSTVPPHSRVWGSGLRTVTLCGIRYSVRYLKLVVCLPVVILGFYLKTRRSFWDEYSLPPT